MIRTANLRLFFVKFARLFADFLDAKFTLLFAKFYESRFFTQAKFGANLSLINPLVFAILSKFAGSRRPRNSIADKFTKMPEKGG